VFFATSRACAPELVSAEWIRVLVSLLGTAAGYWAAMHLLSSRFNELARASHPGEQRGAIEDLDWGLALRWRSHCANRVRPGECFSLPGRGS
jgi:hypothetical protein